MEFSMTIRGSSAVGGPAASAEQACGARLLFGLCLLAAVLATGCASQPSVTDASRRPAKTIADFWAIDTPETVAVVMKSDRPLTYTATRQENPRGVFLQFPDTGLDGMHSVYYPPPNPVLRSIRTAEGAGGSEARVLLELAQDAPYEVVPDSEGLKIVFQKPFAAAAFGGMPAISGTAAAPAKLPTATSKTEPGPPETAGAVPAPAAVLRDVRTEVRADAVLIRVTADGAVKTPNVFTLDNPARIVFDFMGLHSPFKGEQKIPARSEWVRQVRHLGYPDKVRLVADTEARWLKSYSMETTAEGLVITVGAKQP
jgi:hypothetical protein